MANLAARRVFLEVVENQLRANDPPETRQTLERLMAAGYSRAQAKKMIAAAVVEEIWNVLAAHQEFNLQRFLGLLGKLK